MFTFTSNRRATVPAALSCLSFVLSLACAGVTHAQTPTTAAVGGQTITVTGTRTPMRVSDLVADVTVLDRAALDRIAGRTLAEVLSQQAGIQFSSNGGLGKNGSLFIRGLEARHTLLLVDGVRLFSATVGTPPLDNLPLEAIERIEIVRGPMSSLYGSGAMGGVIQVFTRKGAQGVQGNAKLTAGSHRFGEASGGVGFGNGVVDVAAQVQHTQTRGFSAANPREPFGSYNDDRDGFRQDGGSLRVGVQPFANTAFADWRIEMLLLQSKGLTDLDDGPGASARARLANTVRSLSVGGTVLGSWHTRLVVADSSDAYDTLSSASVYASLGEIKTRQRQFIWENTVQTPVGAVLALVDRIEEKVSRPGAPFDVDARDIDGLALGLNGSAAGHVWQASLRHDRNSQFGNQDTGAVAYGYAFAPAWRVGASLGSSYVAPSFNQLYYPDFGNALLQPETGRHAEVSLRWTGGTHSVRAAYYAHRYRGFITSGRAPVNLPKAQIDGVSLAYDGHWSSWDLSASYDRTNPRNATNGNANFDKLLPRRAMQMLRLGADWTAGAWTAGASLAGFSHRFDDAANTSRLGGYGTLDLRAEWALTRELFLGAKLNNVGGKVYETTLGYNQPGREGFVTLRYALR